MKLERKMVFKGQVWGLGDLIKYAIFRIRLVKLRIKLSDLSEMTSYHVNENEAVLLFSRFFTVCTFKKMAT